jgi:hypothetical protein
VRVSFPRFLAADAAAVWLGVRQYRGLRRR